MKSLDDYLREINLLFFQCDRKEYFIEKIKEMDFEVQTQLVPYIQEVFLNMFSSLWDK